MERSPLGWETHWLHRWVSLPLHPILRTATHGGASFKATIPNTTKCCLRRELQQVRVMTDKEGAQQFWIVGPNRRLNAWEFRQLCPPHLHLWRLLEDVEVDQLIKDIEIAEDRREHGVYQAEIFAREERTRAECRLNAGKLRGSRQPLALENRSIG